MSALWRTLAFIFGLPSTIVTFLGVDEGGNRVPHRFTAKGKAGGYQGCRNHLAGDESPWRESTGAQSPGSWADHLFFNPTRRLYEIKARS